MSMPFSLVQQASLVLAVRAVLKATAMQRERDSYDRPSDCDRSLCESVMRLERTLAAVLGVQSGKPVSEDQAREIRLAAFALLDALLPLPGVVAANRPAPARVVDVSAEVRP